MPPKKKNPKKKQKEVEPDDEYTSMTMEQLTGQIDILKQQLGDVRERRNYIQNEKDMIKSFYDNCQKEVGDIEAQIRLKDTEMETREEEHRTEVKVYMQKVQHLEYDMKISANSVLQGGQEMLKAEEEKHEEREDTNKLYKVELKKSIRDKNLKNIDAVKKLQNQHEKSMNTMKKDFQQKLEMLETNYKSKLSKLKEDLDLRLKVEIHEIEERKNQHRNELTKNHEEAFKNLKAYYNSITKNNLDLIKQQKEEIEALKNKMTSREKMINDLQIQNKLLKKPLDEARETKISLQQKLANHDKDRMSLRNAKNRIIVLKDKQEKLKQDKSSLETQLQRSEKERDSLYERFELMCQNVKDQTEKRNLSLDRKLSLHEEKLLQKEAQLEEVVKKAELDQNYVGDISKKIEESLESKNLMIRNLKYSLAHATKAYNDAIRVYEAKLIEFGIPSEELGFQPIESNTSTMPAGLVAA